MSSGARLIGEQRRNAGLGLDLLTKEREIRNPTGVSKSMGKATMLIVSFSPYATLD
jgi:hypothetical protein